VSTTPNGTTLLQSLPAIPRSGAYAFRIISPGTVPTSPSRCRVEAPSMLESLHVYSEATGEMHSGDGRLQRSTRSVCQYGGPSCTRRIGASLPVPVRRARSRRASFVGGQSNDTSVEPSIEDQAPAGANGSGGLAILYLLDACGAVLQMPSSPAISCYMTTACWRAALYGDVCIRRRGLGNGSGCVASDGSYLRRDRSRHYRDLWRSDFAFTALTTSVAVGIAWACAPPSAFQCWR